MRFYYKKFDTPKINLYPLGDWHLGSRQCNESFVRQTIDMIGSDKIGYWVGMGDLMENAIVGSKSDVYMQLLPPKEQMRHIVDLLKPIQKKGLFMIAGNHEQRTMRQVGLIPEEFIAYELDLPYVGFSCLANLFMKSKSPNGFLCYFHHNYGGGFTAGGKVNRATQLRKIVPTADAIFSGHFHITSRIPVTWYDGGKSQAIKHVGYDYITGSALEWSGSYAEERAKLPAGVEFIRVTLIGGTTGRYDNRQQIYSIISPQGKNDE